MAHWLIKSEPETYSYDQLVADKSTAWTGIRNYTARNNLKAMKKGDELFFYHSGSGKEIVGLAKVVKEFYQDPTDKDPAWVCVDVAAVKKFKTPVTLVALKKHPKLKEMRFIKQGRLSVAPVTPAEFKTIIEISNQ